MESINSETEFHFSIPIEQIELLPKEDLLNIDSSKILNINAGILGHVDSGKTSLSKLISAIASTAAFDKNPQSKERGITLDLGFSALYIKTPKKLKELFPNNRKIIESEFIQITLVDCPGHASLIRTVIAGASIIDTVLLVIDIVKGIQPQTIECIALSEILCNKISIILNKIDLIANKEDIEKKSSKLRQIFSKTKFGENIPIIPTKTINIENEEKEKITKLIIKNIIECANFEIEQINNKESLLAYIDHCFKIKNKGTVITGTIMQGNIKINDDLYFPELSNKYTVKEIQVFKKSVKIASKGDRVGLLIKNLDKEKLERSIICSVDSKEVNYLEGGIFILKKINLYKDNLKSNSKYYFMIGNQGILGKCIFFDYNNKEKELFTSYDIKNIKKTNIIDLKSFYEKEFNYLEQIAVYSNDEYYFVFVKFDKKILVSKKMIFLGSNIDIDISENKKDRLAFYGKIISNGDLNEISVNLKIIKNKIKEGRIIRVLQEDNKIAIVKGLIKKENMGNINNYLGKEIYIKEKNDINDEDKKNLEEKIVGKIMSSFGQVGKLKVEFNKEIDPKNLKDIILEMPVKKLLKLEKI